MALLAQNRAQESHQPQRGMELGAPRSGGGEVAHRAAPTTAGPGALPANLRPLRNAGPGNSRVGTPLVGGAHDEPCSYALAKLSGGGCRQLRRQNVIILYTHVTSIGRITCAMRQPLEHSAAQHLMLSCGCPDWENYSVCSMATFPGI